MRWNQDAKEIAREIQRGTKNPVVFKGIDQLLADRKERVAQTHFLRQRLKQALLYLDGLPEGQEGEADVVPEMPAPLRAHRRASPSGMVYFHADQSECPVRGGSGIRAREVRPDEHGRSVLWRRTFGVCCLPGVRNPSSAYRKGSTQGIGSSNSSMTVSARLPS
jgi:hypothetical protein